MTIDTEEACDRLEEKKLTNWEADFIESIRDWNGPLTDAQADVMVRMCRQYLHVDCEPEDFQ